MHETVIHRAIWRAQRRIAESPTRVGAPRRPVPDPTPPTPGTPPEAEPATPAPTIDEPYRPLIPFRADDAEAFFGRTELWRRLHVRAVPGGGPVTVLGPSGSGKTSLLQAGLVPAVTRIGLRRGETRLPASILTMTPGDDPTRRLAERLGVHVGGGVPTGDASAWLDAAMRTHPGGSALLIVVDQAEELFTLCDRRTRSTFLQTIDALSADARCAVVLALQADFYARGMSDPVLVRTLDDRAVVVRMMDHDELVEAIDRPARICGGALEPGLADEIATDIASADGDTPPLIALGVMMDHLWRTRTGTTITAQAYHACDPVTTIVGDTAERAYSALAQPDRETARRILSATVRITGHGDLVGSGITVAGLRSTLREHPHTERVLAHLVDAHLVDAHLVDADLVTVDGERESSGRVQLVHQSLAVSWPRLAEWIDKRRRGCEVITALQADAASWEARRRPDAQLYDAAHVRAADEAMGDADIVDPGAEYFLERSRERLALKTSRRRVLMGALAAVAVVALVVAVTATVRGSDGDTDRAAARLDSTLARIDSDSVADPTAAASLALATYRDAPNDPRARSAVLATQSLPIGQAIGTPADSLAVGTSADGRRTAIADADGSIRIVTTTPQGDRTATVPAAPGSPSPASRGAVAINPGATLLARRGANGSVDLFTLADRSATPAGTIAPAPTSAAGGGVGSLAFSAVRPWLAVTDSAGVSVVDVSDPARPASVGTVGGPISGPLAWNPRLPQLLARTGDARVTLYDLGDPRVPRPRGSGAEMAGTVTSLAFGPDGSTAVAGDTTGAATLFDVGSRGLSPRGPGVTATSGGVTSVALSPGGTRLAVTTSDGSTQIWDVSRPAAPRPSVPAVRSRQTRIAATQFVSDTTLVSAGTGTAMRWSMPTGVLDGGFGRAYPPACSGARTTCVTAFAAGPVQVWDAADPTSPGAVATIDAPGHFNGATISPDGLWMMTSDSRNVAQLWDVRDIGHPKAIGPPASLGVQPLDRMVFSPSSALLATSTDGGRSVVVSDVSLRGLTPIATIGIDGQVIDALAFAPDSRSIALGGDTDVRRWTLGPGGATPAAQSLPIGRPVTAIATVGDAIVVGDATGSVTRWDPTTSAQIGTGVTVGAAAVTSITDLGAGAAISSADGEIGLLGAGGDVLGAGNLFGPGGTGDAHIVGVTPDTVLATGDSGQQQFRTVDAAVAATEVCARTGGVDCR